MILNALTSAETHCAYPGEYIASPVTMEELLNELKEQHEGEANPLVNIEETVDAFMIQMAAPGLNSSDFNVSINGNILTISFLHKDDAESKKIYRQHEFNFCCFKKDIVVPENIDSYFISSVYADGILCIHLPKSVKPFMHRADRIVVY